MMPDRWLMGGDNPARRAAYLMIFMALAIVALAVWNYNLNSRVGTQEAIRRSEARAAAARAASECRAKIAGTKQVNELLASIRDLAAIPQTNLKAYLSGPLTEQQRRNYLNALERYRKAEATFDPYPMPNCVRTDP